MRTNTLESQLNLCLQINALFMHVAVDWNGQLQHLQNETFMNVRQLLLFDKQVIFFTHKLPPSLPCKPHRLEEVSKKGIHASLTLNTQTDVKWNLSNLGVKY